MEFKDVLELITLGGLVLGTTWRLSSQLSDIAATLRAHIKQDEERFRDVENDINTIAPRIVRLPNRR